jgi:cell division protease FtsH
MRSKLAIRIAVTSLALGLLAPHQTSVRAQSSSTRDIPFSQFLTDVDNGLVRRVVIQGPNIHAELVNGSSMNTYAPNYPMLIERLRGKSVEIAARPPDESPWPITLLVSWLPFIMFLALVVWLGRRITKAISNSDRRSVGDPMDRQIIPAFRIIDR